MRVHHLVLLALALAVVGFGIYKLQPALEGPPEVVNAEELIATLDSEARAIFVRLLKEARANPRSAEAHGMLGFAYEANSLHEPATRCFEIAAKLDPTDPVWEYHRITESQSDFAVMLTDLNRLVTRFPRFAAGHHRLGESYLTNGDLDLAEEHFEKCVAILPDAMEVQVSLASTMIQRGDHAGAAATLEPIVARYPGYKLAHYQLGNAYRGLGRMEEAQRELAKGKNPSVLLVRERGAQFVEKFTVSFQAIVDRAADQIDAAQRIGDPREAARLLRGAVNQLERALAMRSDDASAMNNLGVALQNLFRQTGDWAYLDRAIEVLETILQKEDSMGARINLSDCYSSAERFVKAEEQGRKAVALAPDEAMAHMVLARSLSAQDKLEEALVSVTEAVRLDPLNTRNRALKGQLHMILLENPEARRELERVLTETPEDLRSIVNLGNVCIRMGDIPAAKTQLLSAQALAPTHPMVIQLADRVAANEAGRE